MILTIVELAKGSHTIIQTFLRKVLIVLILKTFEIKKTFVIHSVKTCLMRNMNANATFGILISFFEIQIEMSRAEDK